MKKKRNLVIFTLSEKNCDQFDSWCGENRNYDIFVNNFGETDFLDKSKFEYYDTLKGYKFNTLKNIIETRYKDIIQYEYFLFPDPDLKTNVSDVNKLFELANLYNLDLCQPSQTGFISHENIRHIEDDNLVIRILNMVETQCPMFSRTALLICLWTFDLNYSGWGLDWLWPRLMLTLNKKNNVATINSVATEHTKPNESAGWVFPNGQTPTIELEMLLEKFGINRVGCRLIQNIYRTRKNYKF